jgi:hypothetical protein
MWEEWRRFALFALALVAVGVVLAFAAVHSALALGIYLALLLGGMRFVIGATWLGATIGAAIFLAYKIVLIIVIGLLTS